MARPRNLVDSKIQVDYFYNYAFCKIVGYTGPSGDPKQVGPIYAERQGVTTRRFPDYMGGDDEWIMGTIKSIQTGSNQTVEIAVSHEVSWISPSAKTRLLVIPPNTHLDFNLTSGTVKTLVAVGAVMTVVTKDVKDLDIKKGFVLRKGTLKEDKDFKTAREFDDAMTYYSCVSDHFMSPVVTGGVDLLKKANNSPEALAAAVITTYAAGGGGFGVLASMAPIWMLPAEFACDMALNVMKSGLAYAIAYCYTGKKLSSDELKADLYVLFSGDNLNETLAYISDTLSKSGNIMGKVDLIKEVGGSSLKLLALVKPKLASKITAKLSTKGLADIAKALPVVSAIIGGTLNTTELTAFGLMAKAYYGGGGGGAGASTPAAPAAPAQPAAPSTPPSIVVQNNTGAPIAFIETEGRDWKNWTVLLNKSIPHGGKSEVITLTPGPSYKIRIRAAGVDPNYPKSVTYVKKDVKTYANTTTTVVFTANDKFQWVYWLYIEFIRDRLVNVGYKGSGLDGAVTCMTEANTKLWAESYPPMSGYKSPTPRQGYSGVKADKEVIQAQCKFPNQQAVWDMIVRIQKNDHDAFLTAWANSYYNGSQTKPEPAPAPAPKPAAPPPPPPKPATPPPPPPKPAAPPPPPPKPAAPPPPPPPPPKPAAPSYQIGGAGSGGGIVFLAQSGNVKECSRVDIGGGKLTYDNAKAAVESYREGGQTWRLPVKEELDLMFSNLKQRNLGGFRDDSYFGSNQGPNDTRYAKNFQSGVTNDKAEKNVARYVRAVRSC